MSASSDIDYSQIPLGPPPPGGTSNFIDPPRNSWATKVSVYVTLPLIFIFILLRIYARVRVTRKFDLDDWMFVAGCIFSFSYCGIIISWMYQDVYGRHYWDIPATLLTVEFMKMTLAVEILYLVAAIFIKLSLLTLYYRVFRPSKYTTILAWVGAALVVLPYLAFIIVYLVITIPRPGEGGWIGRETLARSGRHNRDTSLSQGIIGTITDFYILTIPLAMIYSLHLKTSKKIGIGSIFVMGSAACAFSIMGIYFRKQSADAVPRDSIWYGSYTNALAVAELNIGLVCSCIPVIFVLFKWPADRLKAAWGSVKSYVSSHTKSSRMATSKDTLVTSEAPGLSGGSQGTPGLGTKSSEYYELQSIDYDYHAYVQGGVKKEDRVKKS
ncbi:hypothetical protein GGR53DRAFT_532907 [Hypoxylon sp. FL1150]|nr:hypothetical protein GGR53DRAFT_532907 [Hypoxylon sp. FL1150]